MKAKTGKILSLTSHDSIPCTRRFTLYRKKDISGNSGTGHVAIGILFPSGHCFIEWISDIKSHSHFNSVADLSQAHHVFDGDTEIHWIDKDS